MCGLKDDFLIDVYDGDCKIYDEAYDIVIVAGQSNAVGFGKGKIDYAESDNVYEVFRKDEYNTKENPQLPLKQFVFKKAGLNEDGTSGFYLFFGKEYEKRLAPGRKLLFVKTAVGATSFSDKQWGKNDYLYLNAIRMAKQIKRGNPGNRIVAVLWHQGESDVYANATKEYYREKLQILIDGFRTELCDSDLPFIAGNMVEEWRNSQPCAANIISATEDVIKNNRNCAFVSSDGLSGNQDGDFIHFSNKANIVFGQRYFKAYESLL